MSDKNEFKPVTLVNDDGDKLEVTTKAQYTQYVRGYGYRPESKAAQKRAEGK